MDTAWLPLFAALLGALAVIAGNALNPYVNSRRAHQQWVRDKRAEVCEEYFENLIDAQDAAEDLFRRVGAVPFVLASWANDENEDADSLEHDDVDDSRAEAAYRRLLIQGSKMDLYTSRELYNKATDASANYQIVYGGVQGRSTRRLAAEALQDFRAEVEEIRILIRAELRVK